MKQLTSEELARRIALDFNKRKKDIVRELKVYCTEVTNKMLEDWENSGELEYQIINGKKYYFKQAVKNLMRLNRTLRTLRGNLEGKERAGRNYILANHIPQVIAQVKLQLRSSRRFLSGLPVSSVMPISADLEEIQEQTSPVVDERDIDAMAYLVQPHDWVFRSRVMLEPDCLPDGTEVKCWQPVPRVDIMRQGVDETFPLTKQGVHASFFTCKNTESGKPTVIRNIVRFTSHAEYHPLRKTMTHKPVYEDSEVLRPYLTEQLPHVKFTEELRKKAKSIVGEETRPYFKARAIFESLRKEFPWIYACEYSTIENIPEYVLKHKGGDCGQITLLFITLCRIIGVPARWQSGFFLMPGYENYHDWAEIFIPGLGWIPVDPSFGVMEWGKTEEERYFYFGGIDAFRMVVNDGWGGALLPKKEFERSEPVDFQRGEVEWSGGNLYFDKWKFDFWVEPVL
jgi:transglutaminase-like putative cysteine protease